MDWGRILDSCIEITFHRVYIFTHSVTSFFSRRKLTINIIDSIGKEKNVVGSEMDSLTYYFYGYVVTDKDVGINFSTFRNVDLNMDDLIRLVDTVRQLKQNASKIEDHSNIISFCRYNFRKFIWVICCSGFIDKNGRIYKQDGLNKLEITQCDENICTLFASFNIVCSIEQEDYPKTIVYEGSNCYDLLSELYDPQQCYNIAKSPLPLGIVTEVVGINTLDIPKILICLKGKEAVMPSKQRPSDIGYDLTITNISEIDKSGVVFYDTGVIIQPGNTFSQLSLKTNR